MKTRYQIFVSATYEDLREERDKVVRAILQMGHIPVGMELFSAADENPWPLIQRHIVDSDYYVVIVAHRYGSQDDERSYTEKEYDYAVEKGVPVLGFVIDDAAPWSPKQIDHDPATVRKLNDFKAKLRTRYIATWTGGADLCNVVLLSLSKQIAVNPRPGWIRASDAAGPEVASELARLSSENALQRGRLASLESQWRELWHRFVGAAFDMCHANILLRPHKGEGAWDDESVEFETARGRRNEAILGLGKALTFLEIEAPTGQYQSLMSDARSLWKRLMQDDVSPRDILLFARRIGEIAEGTKT